MKFQAQKDGSVLEASKTAFLIREGLLEPLRHGMQIKAKDIIVVAEHASVVIVLENGAVLGYDRKALLSGAMAASFQPSSDFVAMSNESADNLKIKTVIHLLEDNQDISGLVYDKVVAIALQENNGFNHVNLERIHNELTREYSISDRSDSIHNSDIRDHDVHPDILLDRWLTTTVNEAPSIKVLSVLVDDSSVLEGQTLDFHVQLTATPTQWLRFAFKLGMGTATNGSDFSETPQFSDGVYLTADGNYVMVPPGVSAFNVTVYTLYDNAFEPLPEETLWLDVDGVAAGAMIENSNLAPAVISIEPANVGISDDGVVEGQPLIFTVTLNSTLGQPATMAYNLGGGTAMGGADYGNPIFSNGVTLSGDGLNLIIPTGINTFTVTVPTFNDGSYESGPNETLPISIGGVAAIGEIIDINSIPLVNSVEPGMPGIGDDAVLEGQSLVFNVTLSNLSTVPTVFSYTLGNGNATSGIDYSIPPILSNGVTFSPDGLSIIVPAGVNSFSVTVATLQDGLDEPGANETLLLNVGGTVGTGYIVDIDGTPSVASIEPGTAGTNDDAALESQSLVFNVTLSNSSSSVTNLSWSLGGGTATTSVDYAVPPVFSNGVTLNANGISLDVPAGVTGFTVSIALLNDGLYEPGANETLPLTIGTVTAVGQIIDINMPPAVTSIEVGNAGSGDDAVNEGQNLVFTVALSNPSATATTLAYNLGGGTATGNSDFTLPPVFSNGVMLSPDGSSLIIPPGVVTFTVTVATINDGIYEPGPAETVPLEIGGVIATGTIIDINPAPTVSSIEPGPAGPTGDTVNEGQSLVFNVTLSNASSSATTLAYSLGTGASTASAGADYSIPPTFSNGVTLSLDGSHIIVPAGVTSFSVTVPTINDGVNEPGADETVSITIDSTSATGAIHDTDATPTVTNVDAGLPGNADDAVNEGDTIVYTVTLSNTSTVATTLTYNLGGGTSDAGIDYNVIPTFSDGVVFSPDGLHVIVPAGVSSFTVSIIALHDGIYEPHPDETLPLQIGGITGNGAIIDTDNQPSVASVEPGSPGNTDDAVNEGQNLVFNVTLNRAASIATSYAWSLGGGTADSADFNPVPVFSNGVTLSADGTNVIVPAGVTSFSVTIATMIDTVYEPGANETLPISIGGMTATGYIVDINAAPTVSSVEVGLPGSGDDSVNEGQNLVFNVTLSNTSTTPTLLAYTLGNGTADAGVDYSTPPTFSNGVTLSGNGLNLIIPAGISSFSVTVATLSDGVYEPGADETVTLNIGGVAATGEIHDTSLIPSVTSIEPGAPGSSGDSVPEGTSVVYTVTLSNTSTVATTIDYSLGGGTATASLDYSISPTFSNGVTISGDGMHVIIPAGTSSFTVSVATINDGIYEPQADETLPLTIGTVTATASIIDINQPPTISSIEPGAPGNAGDSVNEGQDLVFNVTLSNPSTISTSYAWSLGGGTASSGADYAVPSNLNFTNGVTLGPGGLTLIVPSGVTSFSVTVPTVVDGVFEGNETVPITIGGVTATGTIIDIDTSPIVLSIEPGAAGIGDDVVDEGQTLVFTVNLSNPSSTVTTLAYSLGGGSASSGADFTVPPVFSNGVTLSSNGQNIIIPVGVTSFTVSVPTINDSIFESATNETVPLTIAGVTGTGEIHDLQAAPSITSIEAGIPGSSDDAVVEGQNLVFTVTLNNASSTDTTMAYQLGGTAASGIDYSVVPIFSNGVTLNVGGTTLNIPTGVSSFTVTYATFNDGIYEPHPDETLTLTIGGTTGNGAITDINTQPTVSSIEPGAAGTSDDAVNEGQNLVFTITLSNPSSTTTTLAYNLGGGTATGGTDYTAPATFSNGVTLSPDGLTLIVPAGVTSFTATVPTINDGLYEPGANETVPLSIGGITATGQIVDVNTAPTVSTVNAAGPGTGDDAVNEGQNLVFNVTLSNASSTATTLAYSLGGGTATSGIDYSVPPTFSNGVTLSGNGLNLIIPAGVTSFSISVPTLNDGIYEPGANETVPLTIGGMSATGQIVDVNTAPTVTTVEPGAPGSAGDAVNEGQVLVFNVSLSNTSNAASSFSFALSGTATAGIDYTVTPVFSNGVTLNADGVHVDVPAGVSSFSVSYATLNDGIYEPGINETLVLQVGSTSSTGQIVDINSTPTVSSIEPGAAGTSDDAVNEGQNLVFTITLSNPSSTTTTLAYNLGGGTATGGTDYTAPPTFSNGVTLSPDGLTLIVPAGVTSFTATVPTINDGLYEPGANETVPLSIGGITATGQVIDVNSVPTVTIVNAAGPGTGDDAVNEGQNLVFNVTLSNASSTATTLAYSLGGGTATSGIDYSVPPTFSNGVTLSGNGLNLIIPAGVTSFSISVPTLNDGIYEPGANETVPLTIGGMSATGQIVDVNTAPTVSSVEPGMAGTSDDAVQEGQSLVFNVTLSNPSATVTTLAYSLGGGTAASGMDYNLPPTFSNGVTLNPDGISLNIPAGVTSFSITVATIVDGVSEALDETVPLTVGGMSSTGYITDVDVAPNILTIEPGAAGAGDDAVNEGQSLVYTVTLSGVASTALSYAYNLGGGTATGGSDYTAPATFSNGVTLSPDGLTLIVPAGVTSFTATVPTINDGLYEPGANETVPLSIGGITATGQIVDVNTAPTVSTVNAAGPGTGDDAVNEGQNLVFNVTLSNASSTATTLAYSLGGGTATSGIDYSVPPTFSNGVTLSGNGLNLIIPAGVTSFSISVPTLNDGIYEPGANETVPLTIGGMSATGQIVDVNTAPTVTTVEPGAPGSAGDAVNEGQVLVFNVSLSNTSNAASSFSFALSGTATAGIDYTVTPVFSNGVTLNADGVHVDVPAGVSSFSVSYATLNDGIYEPGINETLVLQVGSTSSTGQIVDINSTPTVSSIEPGAAGTSDDAVNEGQNLVFTITLSNPSSTTTTLAYNLGGGTATGGTDYTAPPTFSNGVTLSPDGLTLIVPAGVTSFTATVPTINDGLYEPGANETVPLSIGGITATGQVIDVNSVPTVTIVNAAGPGAGDDAVNEGQNLVFNVTLSNASSTATTLAYSLGGGTATSGIDYSVPPTFSNGVTLSGNGLNLIIPAGVTSFSISVPTLNDGIYEPGANETVPLTIGGMSATGQIVDVNTAPTVTTVEPGAPGSAGDAVNEGQVLVFNVSLSNTSNAASSFSFALSGTATAGIDYTVTPVFSNGVTLNADGVHVDVPAGVSSFSVSYATLNDGIYEPGINETLVLQVGSTSSTGQIVDINSTPTVSSIEPGAAGTSDDAVNEGQNLVFTITLSNPSSTTTTLAYNLGGGTATGGTDYTAPATFSNGVTLSPDGLTLIVPAGVTSFTATVPTINDGLYEPGANETVPLSIGGITATGQIVDVNTAPTVSTVNAAGPGTGDDAVNEGQNLVFNITLSNPSSTATTLAYSLGGGTATSGVDYSVPPTFSNGVTLSGNGLNLIVPAGVTSFSISVPTLNDGIYEPGANETVPLTVGGMSATGQIVDVNTAPTVTSVEPGASGSTDDAVVEGQNITYHVTLSNPSTTITTLAYSLGGGTATSGLDFSTPSSFTNGVTISGNGLNLIVPAGVTSFDVIVATINDTVYEPGVDETVPLTIGGITATGMIIDNDSAPTVVSIEPGAPGIAGDAVNEGQALVYNVVLSNTSATATTLAYSLGGGTATATIDYSVTPTFSNGVTLSPDHLSVIVPAGVSSFSVSVATLNDGIYEPGANETLPLSIGSISATGQIIDVNSAPTVSSVEPGSPGPGDNAVNEGQNLVYTVTLSNASSASTTLAYNLGGGTATSGIDYSVPPTFSNGVTLSGNGLNLIVPAGVTSFTVTVPALNDGVYEPGANETVPLSVGGIIGTGQIIDQNTVPKVSSIEPGAPGTSDDAVNEGQNLVFNVALTNSSTVASTLAYSLAGGSATSGVDYTALPVFSNGVTLSGDGLSLIVPAGVNAFSVSVHTLNDGIYEPGINETVQLNIGGVGGVTAIGQIIDINTSPTVTSIEPGNPGTADDAVLEGRNIVYQVTLSNPSAATTTLAYTLGGGTATSGSDFTTPPTFSNGVTLSGNGLNLIIPAGVTSFTVTVATVNDGIREAGANETVPLTIGGVTGTGQIIDNSFYTSEEGLAGSNPDTTGTPTDFTNSTSVTGFIGINSISSIVLSSTVSSGGNVISTTPVLQGDGSYSFGYTSSGNFIQVANFRIDGSGNFTFNLLKALDHPIAGAEDTLLFTVRVNNVDIGLYVEDDSPFISSAFTQALVPLLSENIAPVVNNPSAPNLLGLANVGLPSVVVTADLLSAASASISLTDYASKQAFTAYDANNNLQKVVLQYSPLINLGLPSYSLTYSSDIAAAFGLQIRSFNDQGVIVAIGLGTKLEITSLDGGVIDNLAINQFLNTVHFNSSGLLSLDVLSSTSIVATDMLGISSNATVGSLLSLNLLNPASYAPINGGSGNDTLTGTSGNDQISGAAGNDSLSGLAGNDVIFGNDGNDRLDGGSGNDLLMGGAGNDTIIGGTGNDLIYSGAGNDSLTGGANNDFFIFTVADKGNLGTPAVDTITDFSKTEDYLDLRNLLQGENTASIQKFISIENSGGNTLIHISTNGGFASGYSAAQENETIILNGTFTQAEVMSRLLYDANALTGSLNGSFGADGGYVASLNMEGTTYTYNATTNSVTSSNVAIPVNYDANTHILTINTSIGEKVTVNVLNGNYSYLDTSAMHIGQYSTLNYTLTDFDGDTSTARLEFAGQQAYPATAPVVDQQVSGSLLGLIGLTALQSSPATDLIDLKSQQIFTAYDVNNNLQSVEIKYAGLLGLLGNYSLTASTALADQLGLHISVVDTAAVTVLGTPVLAPTSTLTITASDGGVINNFAINELLGTVTFTHSGLLNDVLSAQLLSATTIKATDTTGLFSTSTTGSLADISLLTGSQTVNPTLEGTTGNDNITGTASSDRIYGYAGNDNLNGGNGNDLIHGGAGSDTIHGGSGNDIIIGGAGSDLLFGELGADVFRWEFNDQGTNASPVTDIISDFSSPAHSLGGDVLDLRDLLVGESHLGTDSGNLSNYLNFSVNSGNTTIKISTAGDISHGFNQVVVLQNVDLVGSMQSDQQVIANLLNAQKLVVD